MGAGEWALVCIGVLVSLLSLYPQKFLKSPRLLIPSRDDIGPQSTRKSVGLREAAVQGQMSPHPVLEMLSRWIVFKAKQ